MVFLENDAKNRLKDDIDAMGIKKFGKFISQTPDALKKNLRVNQLKKRIKKLILSIKNGSLPSFHILGK